MEGKKESPPKSKTIKSLLDPLTEKRLIGDLKPPKRHLSYSEKPPRIERMIHMSLKPPKAAENLSKLDSVQTFIKDFQILESEIHYLRQYSCPPNSDKLFSSVADIHDKIPMFEVHCKTITKQKKLHAEINPKAFEYYKSFVISFDFFIEKLELYRKQIHNSYSHAIKSSFRKIEKNVNSFFEICYKDPQARTIAVQYRKYCDDSVKEIKDVLKPYLEQEDFDHLNDEQLDKFSETTKTFGRFFEKELFPLIASNINPRLSISEYIDVFHEKFVYIVPMITSAPFFVEQYKIIMDKVEILKEDINKVKNEVGDERILKIRPNKKQEVKVTIEQDDIKPALNDLVKYFEPKITDYDKDSDILVKIKEAAEEKIGKLKSEIKSLENKIIEINNKKPVDIATEQYKMQFSDIKKLKKQLEEKILEENANFNRSIIYSIRNILSNPRLNTSDSHIHQAQSLITQCKEEMDKIRAEMDKTKGDFSKTKDYLSEIYETPLITEEMPLNNLAMNVVSIVKDERKNYQKTIDDMRSLVREMEEKVTKMLTSNFGVDNEEINDKNYDTKLEIAERQFRTVVEDLRRSRNESASSNASLKEICDKLTEISGKEKNLDSTIDNIKKIIEDIDDELKDKKKLQNEMISFVSSITENLTIPGINSPKNYNESKITMHQIMSSLENSQALASSIMDNSPTKGLFKNASAYRSLALDITSKLLNMSRSDLSGQKFDDIKKGVFDKIEFYETVVNLGHEIEKVEKESQDSMQFMTRIKEEIENSRKLNENLGKMHDTLKQMTEMINGEKVFLPKTEESKKLKSISELFQNLKDKDNEILSTVVQDLIDFNDKLYDQIQKGKFSPKRNRKLIKQNERLENENFNLKEKLIAANIELPEEEDKNDSSSSSSSSSSDIEKSDNEELKSDTDE